MKWVISKNFKSNRGALKTQILLWLCQPEATFPMDCTMADQYRCTMPTTCQPHGCVLVGPHRALPKVMSVPEPSVRRKLTPDLECSSNLISTKLRNLSPFRQK